MITSCQCDSEMVLSGRKDAAVAPKPSLQPVGDQFGTRWRPVCFQWQRDRQWSQVVEVYNRVVGACVSVFTHPEVICGNVILERQGYTGILQHPPTMYSCTAIDQP